MEANALIAPANSLGNSDLNSGLLDSANILITGGTGSFGKMFTRVVCEYYKPDRITIYSRDEFKQFEMQQLFNGEQFSCLHYVIGDVRDKERLHWAMGGADIVVHAAALKQVPTAEYNPSEAIKTNVLGALNVIDCALNRGVKKVIALSTDKAANPINLYGATKLCADKSFMACNSYMGITDTLFSVVRYGNVLGSRGSVIPFFLKLSQETGVLPITDKRMTRFWITLRQGVYFVLNSLRRMQGGELFVPKLPSMRIVDLARAICPDCRLEYIGIRPGEKIHEVLVPQSESPHTIEYDSYFAILARFPDGKNPDRFCRENGGKPCPQDFRYSSDQNDWWMSIEDMRRLIHEQANDTLEKWDIGF